MYCILWVKVHVTCISKFTWPAAFCSIQTYGLNIFHIVQYLIPSMFTVLFLFELYMHHLPRADTLFTLNSHLQSPFILWFPLWPLEGLRSTTVQLKPQLHSSTGEVLAVKLRLMFFRSFSFLHMCTGSCVY